MVIRHAITTETCQRAEAVKLSQTVVDVFPHVRGLCCDIIQICVKAPLSRSADVIEAHLANSASDFIGSRLIFISVIFLVCWSGPTLPVMGLREAFRPSRRSLFDYRCIKTSFQRR